MLLILFIAVALRGCIFAGGGFPSFDFHEVLISGEGEAKILLIDVQGVISNQSTLIPGIGVVPGMLAQVRQELEIAYDDPDIRGVLLRINSPGGGITDSDILHHSLVEFKRTKKVKIVAAMMGIAASGGLYVAMAADEVYAHPTTITGSMGVINYHMEFSGLMEKLGIRAEPLKTGEYKDTFSPFRPRTEKENKLLQAILKEELDQFKKVVREGRPKMSESQLKLISDARILTPLQARSVGLIDHIGYLDDAYKRISELSGFPKNRLIRYANVFREGENIYSGFSPIE